MKKKIFALILALAMALAFAIPAFAGTHAYMEWNEETQEYGIRVYEDEDDKDDVYHLNPEAVTPYDMNIDINMAAVFPPY